jgi:hypothetical protein
MGGTDALCARSRFLPFGFAQGRNDSQKGKSNGNGSDKSKSNSNSQYRDPSNAQLAKSRQLLRSG